MYVNVAISVPLHKSFTYAVPAELEHIAISGTRVVVPFRRKERIGYILEANVEPNPKHKIKDVISFPDAEPIISEKLFKLLKWISEYYCSPIGEVFAASLPNMFGNAKELGKEHKQKALKQNLDGFFKNDLISLNLSQSSVQYSINQKIDEKKFAAFLLHGVTGSGKTEIYLRLIEKVRVQGKQAILLVPEISLAPQLTGRLASYFKESVAVYHSGLTEVQRLNQWKLMKNGEINIVVGTRSAIFAPFKRLGAIIVDEEHDNSYKQEESPRYQARDTAIMRGKIEDAVVVLGSATPSIESCYNAKSGKYHFLELPKRHGDTSMPDVQVIDMRKELRSSLLNPHLSMGLLFAIEKNLKTGHQTILFLNRRGYSNFIMCRDCGYIPQCPNCNITLTYHKGVASLRCHYCDYGIPLARSCPKCNGNDLQPIGSGTEMIEEAIKKRLPQARLARLDRDTATTEKKRREALSKMHRGEIDILIGTQMVTKGHDFPNVTLVGIISADQSIHFPDFRAAERTFQLITQVSGRAGRALHPGTVIVQTYDPDHISIQTAAGLGLNEFLKHELELRRELFYPPFSRLANIKVAGNKEKLVIDISKNIAQLIEKFAKGTELRLLGPAPAPLTLLKGATRWQMLIKSPSANLISKTLYKVYQFTESTDLRGTHITIDVDPVSTM